MFSKNKGNPSPYASPTSTQQPPKKSTTSGSRKSVSSSPSSKKQRVSSSSHRRPSTIAAPPPKDALTPAPNTEGAFPLDMPIKINDVRREDLVEIVPKDGSRRIRYEKGRVPVSGSSERHQQMPYQCWKLTVPVEKFVGTIPDRDAKLLRSQDLTIHFPVFDKFYAVKRFKIRGHLTTEKLLTLVQRMGTIAIAMYVKDKHHARTGQKMERDVKYGEVHCLLDKHTTCSLLLTPARPGYNVYVM